ncbi:ubiquinone biosynthesis protein COQ4, putative [Eimeria maxima]|uniref:Ubiquinone biosynthesis protein COQ4, putative n=1 Tax=Eimeria maxima TaxID=5804 RepID=U6MAG3_EIMMA|nr:ubiquinone biosynthesis protein COQ4, putative [Eimeria maxima]CDJ61207.1 ubiquinone biosynthesis protein COQ4, putative [Eimeria maxima]
MASRGLWSLRSACGLSSIEAFSRQHRLNKISLNSFLGGPQGAPPWVLGGPWGGPPGAPSSGGTEGPSVGTCSAANKPERVLKAFEWVEGEDSSRKKEGGPLGAPDIGSAGDASGSPLNGREEGRERNAARESDEGREVLEQRLLLDGRFINYDALRRLPKNTLGYKLMHFLDSNSLHAGHRQPVRFVEDEELAYVLTRYRQLHDVMHAAFDLGISIEAEISLKLIEFYQTGLPLSAAAADAAHAGEASAAVAKAAHRLTQAPNSCMQLLLPQEQHQQQQQQQQQPATGAAESQAAAGTAAEGTQAAGTAAAAAAAEEPVVLYPRSVLLNEMLPWVR